MDWQRSELWHRPLACLKTTELLSSAAWKAEPWILFITQPKKGVRAFLQHLPDLEHKALAVWVRCPVPCNRTTMGILRSRSLTAMMMPWAMTSHLMIPPKMLTRMAWTWRKNTKTCLQICFIHLWMCSNMSNVMKRNKWFLTFLSEVMSLKASVTWWAVAPPPTSKKFAGVPPCSLMMSMVAMASPAPFTEEDKQHYSSFILADQNRLLVAALTQTADGSVQADVVQVGRGGLPVPGVLLRPVPHLKDLLLSIRCVGVEVDLCIHAHDWGEKENLEIDPADFWDHLCAFHSSSNSVTIPHASRHNRFTKTSKQKLNNRVSL